jgi:methyltransferase (TIGR00027 family)
LEQAMKENSPSRTALGVAVCRAAHQVLDSPPVFSDPLVLRILGMDDAAASPSDPRVQRLAGVPPGLRAFLAARSRYAEDELARAVARGVRRYVVLGAGLDTFAYRNPYPADTLRVFEVDHPATQAFKRARLEQAGIPVPDTLTFAPVDFETRTLPEGLGQAGFDNRSPAFFSWLGVAYYLTEEAIDTTLGFVASLPVGSGIVFDYGVMPSLVNSAAREGLDALSDRVNAAGEPFRTFFDPAALTKDLTGMGFTDVRDLGPDEINARYFTGRADNLAVGGFARLMSARV